MASETDTSTAGHSDSSAISVAALRLDPLLRRIRDELSQYLEAFVLAIHGARLQDIKWPLLMMVVPDPGDGGTIVVAQQEPSDFVGVDNFYICKLNIPVSEADIETATSYLRNCGLDPDAERLLEEFKGLRTAFCSMGEFIPLSNNSTANRKFYAQDRALVLSEHLEELIRTLPTILTGGGAVQSGPAPDPKSPPPSATTSKVAAEGKQETPEDPAMVVLRHTRDGLSGRTLRLFDFLVDKSHKTYFEELRDDSTVFTKADISDSGIATGIKDLIRDLQGIEAPYIVEWSKGDKWVRLDEKPRV